MERHYIAEIKKEYKKIDLKWLNLHFKTSAGLVLFAFVIECGIGILLYYLHEIHTTIPIYIIKYLVAPMCFNLLFIILDYFVLYHTKFSQQVKIYIVSLMFVMICFVLFSVHIIFSVLYFLFALPILLTTIYCSYRLTIVIAIASIAADIISELFVKWDSEKVSILVSGDRLADFIISLCFLIAFSIVCIIVIRFEKEKNAASIQKELQRFRLEQKILTDELTGINNRTALNNAIHEMEMDITDNTYIMVMIDLDNFKKLNDNYGHLMGDQCLIEFSNILKAHCGDAASFRYGGDEFCILFLNRTLKNVVETCQRIQEAFGKVKIDSAIRLSLTASFGIADYIKSTSAIKLLNNTDKALYQSKIEKNAIRIYGSNE
jgi:diguanylate cyclase (GGDEF) domain